MPRITIQDLIEKRFAESGAQRFPPTLRKYLDEEYPTQPPLNVAHLWRQIAGIMTHLKAQGFWK